MNNLIDFLMFFVGICLQGYGIYLTIQHENTPVPKKYEKLYEWIEKMKKNPKTWQPEIKMRPKVMDSTHEMFSILTDLFNESYEIENQITTIEFTNFLYYPIILNNVIVNAISNGSLQKKVTLNIIIENMNNKEKRLHSQKTLIVFLVGTLISLTNFFINKSMSIKIWIVFALVIIFFLFKLVN